MNQDPQNNGYIIPLESAAEMARLTRQAYMVSEAMQGDHPLVDRSKSSTILDLAGGPGEWALRTAEAFPKAKVVSVDISKLMTKGQREIKNLPNAQFRKMDITHIPLDFAADTFDFIHRILVQCMGQRTK